MRRDESPWWSAGYTKQWWKSLTPVQQFQFMETLSAAELESFYRDWRVWGRDDQLAPPGDDNWTTWLALAGRGWGKTRTGSEHVIERERRGYGRMCLLGQGEDDVREVMIEGNSGIIASAPSDRRPKFYPSVGAGRLEWPSGAVAFVYSAADPEALRGPNFEFAWVDEPLAFNPEARQKAMSNLRFGLRLKGPKGEPPQQMLTTTPKPHRYLKDLIKQAGDGKTGRIRITRGSTLDNRENLSSEAVDDMLSDYEGTQLGRQELYAEILSDEAGALFHDTALDKTRIRPPAEVAEALAKGDQETYDLWLRAFARTCDKVVVAVDPNLTSTSTHAAGIVVAAKKQGRRFVLKDASVTGGPSMWARKCIEMYEFFDADEMVVEVNQGGDLVKMTVEAEAKVQGVDVVFKKVRAWKGKRRRAEPVAAAYERGDVSHLGDVGHQKAPGPMYRLEQQLCALHDGFDPTGEDFDRADACIYAVQRLGRKGDDDSEGEAASGGGFFMFGELAGAAA